MLAKLSEGIAELQKQLANPQPINWLQQITGSFKDEPAFEEVLAYGRAIRRGDDGINISFLLFAILFNSLSY